MPSQKSNYKLLFIVGFPRSGTTWIMWLLAQHPEVVACFHAGFFHALQPLYHWWQDKAGLSKSVYAHKNQRIKLYDILSIEKFYTHARSLAKYVFDQIADCNSLSRVVVEKTPENLEFASWILKIFPEAYILHVIRDPRSIYPSFRNAAYSWLQVPNMSVAPNPFEVAKGWRSYIERGKQLKKITDNYREIQYETLFNHGIEELQKIYAWLDLPADQAFCEKVMESSKIEELRKKKYLAPQGFFRKGKAEGWTEELSSRQTRIIEYLAGDLMQKMGYKLTCKKFDEKPWEVSIYEVISKILRKFSHGPDAVLERLSKFNSLNGRLNPKKRLQILIKTLTEMTK